MAMGLGFLGRESRVTSVSAGAVHVVFATLGGALTGAAAGSIGLLIGLGSSASTALLIVIGALALAVALRRQPMKLGRPCQVPKQWSVTMPAKRLYATWGLMLGAGVVTLIPYSAHLVLLVGQLVAGPLIGAISGAVYGAVREAVALTGVGGGLQPVPAMDALERWATPARLANIGAVAIGGTLLVVASL
jgi:hypothetical protein